MPHTPGVTLFDKYGGVETVRKLVKEFFERVHAKPTLRRYFEGIDKERVIKHQIDLVTYVMGKPPPDLDIRHLPDKHHRLGITLTAFEDTVGILRQVLLEANVEGRDIALILSRMDANRHRIVRDAAAPAREFNPDHVDALTGLGNQAGMDLVLDAELGQFRASGQDFSLALGRMVAAAGAQLPASGPALDHLVRNFSGSFARITRSTDELFRLDDGLFAVALRRTTAERAVAAARRLRTSLSRTVHAGHGVTTGIDLEVGLATATPALSEASSLLAAARQALEKAAASATQKIQQA